MLNSTSKKKKTIGTVLAAFALPFIVVIIIFSSKLVSLPGTATLAAAENLGQVFEKFRTGPEVPWVLPKGVDTYPTLLTCAICKGGLSTKCTLNMSIKVAQQVSDQRSHIYFVFDSLLLGGAIWLKYSSDQIQRLYLGVYTNSGNYHGLDTVCQGVLHKNCLELSRDDVVYLHAWIEGRDWLVNRLKEDPSEFERRLSRFSQLCTQ